MTNNFKKITILIILIIAIFTLSSCEENNNTLIINLDTQGGETLASLVLDMTNTSIELPIPVKEGYVFLGWFLTDSFEELYVFDLKDLNLSSITIYAKWEHIIIDISFYVDDDRYDKSFLYGDVLIFDESIEKEGYTFDGWYESANYLKRFDGNIVKDTNLYGRFVANTYTLTYDYQYDIQPFVEKNSYSEKLSLETPTRERYQFLGWYEDADYEKIFSLAEMPARDVNLYAKWEQIIMSITFDPNGGSVLTSNILINKDTYPGSFETPIKTGHTFLGWYIYGSETIFDGNSMFLTEDIHLVAKYELTNYQLKIEKNNGSNQEIKSLNYNQLIPNIEIPSKSGHAFQGWYLDDEFTIILSFTNMPSQDITIYAKWQVLTYTITFNADGGSSVSLLKATFLSEISEPNTPIKDKHQFLGWFESLEATNTYIFDKMPNRNVTLYAKWKQVVFTLTLNPDDGVLTENILYKRIDQVIGTLEVPSKTGHTFDGWYDISADTLIDTTVLMPERDIEVIAKWVINTYTITFDTDGGNILEKIEKTYNEVIGNLETPIKEGHTFISWDQVIQSTMPASNILLKALWEVNIYKINYVDDQDQLITSHNVFFGQTLSEHFVVNALKEGHSFISWSNDLPKIMPSSDLTFKAIFALNTYSINFIASETEIEIILLDYLEEISLEPIKLPGYRFNGYYIDILFTQPFNIQSMPSRDLTVYVNFVYEGITISFSSLGGSLVKSINTLPGEKIEMPISPTRDKYQFLGWFESLEATNTYIFDKMPAESINLYAKWKQVVFTLTLNPDDGVLTENILYKRIDQVIGTLEVPSKTGHTFDGWYDISADTLIDTTVLMPERDIEVIAKWVINTYTITFDTDGGSSVNEVSVIYEREISEPNAPIKNKHEFLGWKLDLLSTDYYNFDKMPAENITLFADWKLLKDNLIHYEARLNSNNQVVIDIVVSEYVYFSAFDIVIRVLNQSILSTKSILTPFDYVINQSQVRLIYSDASNNITFETVIASITIDRIEISNLNIELNVNQWIYIDVNYPKEAIYNLDDQLKK